MIALVFVTAYGCVEANKKTNHYNNVLGIYSGKSK
jgi:hypothetical protein